MIARIHRIYINPLSKLEYAEFELVGQSTYMFHHRTTGVLAGVKEGQEIEVTPEQAKEWGFDPIPVEGQ